MCGAVKTFLHSLIFYPQPHPLESIRFVGRTSEASIFTLLTHIKPFGMCKYYAWKPISNSDFNWVIVELELKSHFVK